jgi:hypothetical protein
MIWEDSSFVDTTMFFNEWTRLYVQNSLFKTGSDKRGFLADGALSMIGCTFMGCGTGYEGLGDKGDHNGLLACGCRFIDCAKSIDVGTKTFYWISNCAFSGWSDFALKLNGDDPGNGVKQCAFYAPTGSGPAIISFSSPITLDSVCFGYVGVSVKDSKLVQTIKCRFKAEQGTALVNVAQESDLSGASFGLDVVCTEGDASLDDRTACVWSLIPPRRTPRPTKSPRAAKEIFSRSPGPTLTLSAPDTVTVSPEATVTISPDATLTLSPEATVTISPEATVTISPDATLTLSPEATVSPRATVSWTPVGSPSSRFETEEFTGTSVFSEGFSAVARSLAFSGTPQFSPTDDHSITRPLRQTGQPGGTFGKISSANDHDSTPFQPTLSVQVSQYFAWPTAQEPSQALAASLPFTASGIFSATRVFSPSPAFLASAPFSHSLPFTSSDGFSESGFLIASDGFTTSAHFTELPQGSAIAGAQAEQLSGGVSGAAIGGGAAGGLAALAALVLLLLLFKKKKNKIEQPEETAESTVGTIDEEDAYVSEYGLSDEVRPLGSDEDREDLPREGLDNSGEDGLAEHVSEHNPE